MIFLDCLNRTNPKSGRIVKRNSQVEEELSKLVDILVKVVPSLTEVRVFGSYNNGNWNPKKSDVDVLIETADENYSRYKDRREGNFQGETLESIQRRETREKIEERFNPSRNLYGRFSLHFLSGEDVRKSSLHYTGNFVLAAKEGRLLYQNKQNQTIN